ncbi:hypothetical protein [Halorubrum aquaticum]|uniref:hypothetical protein n=1 Tax=Halorubrum aquaticum TaxID=387340 RepID=UPI0031E1A10B
MSVRPNMFSPVVVGRRPVSKPEGVPVAGEGFREFLPFDLLRVVDDSGGLRAVVRFHGADPRPIVAV